MLGDMLVGVQFAGWDRGDDFVVRGEDEMYDFLDMWCDSGREKYALSVCCCLVRETVDDIF